MPPVVILSATRTPVGSFQGALASGPATWPGAAVIRGAEELIAHAAQVIGRPLSPREVHAVTAPPRTRSGKTVRGVTTRAYPGRPVGDVTSVENPEALEAIAALADPAASGSP
jgi:hypothetical protein